MTVTRHLIQEALDRAFVDHVVELCKRPTTVDWDFARELKAAIDRFEEADSLVRQVLAAEIKRKGS